MQALNDTVPEDELDSDDNWLELRKAANVADLVLFSLNFFAIVANGFVIRSSGILYRQTLDPTHLLIGSMTFADLLTCVTQQFRTFMTRMFQNSYPMLLIAQMELTWISYSASGFSLCLLNLEKLLYFHWPLHYILVVTATSTILAIVASWLLCLIYALILLHSATSGCDDDFCLIPDQLLYRYYIIMFCILPAASSGCLSLYLYLTVKHKRESTTNISLSRQLKTMVFIFSATTWVVVSWVPARLHFIFLLENSSMFSVWFGFVTNYLLLLSPMVNPVITIIVYSLYRKLAKKCYETLKARASFVDVTHLL